MKNKCISFFKKICIDIGLENPIENGTNFASPNTPDHSHDKPHVKSEYYYEQSL
jgi:hypothetical protein